MRKWYPVALIVAAFAVSAAVFGRLPDRIATHFDGGGNPNGWSNRFFGAFLLPSILLLVWPIMRFLPRIDPRRANYEKFQGTYDALIYSVMTLMLVIHLMILGGALGLPIRIERVMPVLVGTMLIVVGNLLPRARSNFFLGIRTPWTLSSDRVWDRTHRLGGYLFMAAGVVVVASAMLNPVAGGIVMGIAIGAAALISCVYSYFVWRREPRSPAQPGGTSQSVTR